MKITADQYDTADHKLPAICAAGNKGLDAEVAEQHVKQPDKFCSLI
jgi:hypothetical protein